MKLTKRIFEIARNLFGIMLGFMVAPDLYIQRRFKSIKLCLIVSNRIGEIAGRTDLFLRRLQLKKIDNEILYLGIASSKTANKQLLKMFRRKMPIIENEVAYQIIEKMCYQLFEKPGISPNLRKFSPFEELPFKPNPYYEYSHTERNLYFTESEEEKGKKLLEKIGINSWFVCFHSRDPAYLSKTYGREKVRYHDYRDCDIENYMKAAKYIADKGGFAVRMGSSVADKLPDLSNPRIIDYASYYRSDFCDIYLPAKCKFFLGSSAGLILVSTLFHVPTAWANLIPFDYTPFRRGDMYIPKKIWSIKEKRFLTFREILEFGIGDYARSEQYAEAGVKPVENTADEILDIAIEMNERLDGTFETTKEDEELQKKFHSLFKPHHHCYGTPARIGTKFLRNNKDLLE